MAKMNLTSGALQNHPALGVVLPPSTRNLRSSSLSNLNGFPQYSPVDLSNDLSHFQSCSITFFTLTESEVQNLLATGRWGK